ncbi:MAG: tellurite resistance TerB family protein [Alphaproteobacteria bacterium]|nr:tellurite resistance TerB family protein [Alphaproteobacteria bacterium]MDE2630869.1 tellurite resistance TerB family protein [Alphaproteobacteria bacterium]
MRTISHHAALVYVMVVVSAADGAMSDKELRAIGDLTRSLPVFKDFDRDRLVVLAQDCSAILQEEDGLAAVLGLVKDALPEPLRETAYWLALEVALTDSHIKLEEVRIIKTLRRTLGIDRLVAAALERGARARFQVA